MNPYCLNIVNREQEVQLYKFEFYIIANKYTTPSSAIVSASIFAQKNEIVW